MNNGTIYPVIEVTAVIPTRGRYHSTLPLALMSVTLQIRKPKRIIIYDDGEKLDLRGNPTYMHLFKNIERYGIQWDVKFGEGLGPAVLHDRSIADSDTEFIWRLDDDCVAEPDVLFKLWNAILCDKKTGAVGGIVSGTDALQQCPSFLNGTLDDVLLGQNVQWYTRSDSMQVQHLYSSFLYRKAAAAHGYNKSLSKAGHREETLFTHQMYLNGWNLLFDPSAVSWHYTNPEGGQRVASPADYAHNENVFMKTMREEWKSDAREPLVIPLEGGIGDHYAFKHVLPDIIKANVPAGRRIILACCYPEVFADFTSVEICSIRDAVTVFGEGVIKSQNIYAYMSMRNWDGERDGNIVAAYKKQYGV